MKISTISNRVKSPKTIMENQLFFLSTNFVLESTKLRYRIILLDEIGSFAFTFELTKN